HRPSHPGRVARVVGNERRGSDGCPALETAVHDFDGWNYRINRIDDFVARPRCRSWCKIAPHAKSKLRFHHASHELIGFHPRGTLEIKRREQSSEKWTIHLELLLRDQVGARDLITDHVATVVGEQSVQHGVLAIVRFLIVHWPSLRRD